MVYCHPDLILEGFCWICVDGMEVIFCYEVLYLSASVIIVSLFLSFVFIDLSVRISEYVLLLE